MKQNPYYYYSLFELLELEKQTRDQFDQLKQKAETGGLLSRYDATVMKLLKEKLAAMNAEINDKTK
jgi:hypothetical protein